MTSARVNITENDISAVASTTPGVTGALVIPALKGPVGFPTLITNPTQLLSVFTPAGTVDVGMSLGFYSALAFLQKSNSLYVVRSANGALYGGLTLKSASSPYANASFTAGVTDPSAYVFDGQPDVPGVAQDTDFDFTGLTGTSFDVSGTAKYFTFTTALDALKYLVHFIVSDGSNTQTAPALPSGAAAITVTVLSADNATALATKAAAAITTAASTVTATATAAVLGVLNNATGATTSATANTSGVAVTVETTGVTQVNQVDEAIAIFGNSPGAYNNVIGVQVVTDPTLVKVANAFVINVFANGNASTPVETWTCSRTPGQLDGFGQNMYIEDLLQGSNYITALSNPAIDPSVLPKAQPTTLFMANGSDGSAVTDSNQVSALQAFSNPDDISISVIMDGGWATPAYALAADTIVQARQDSVSVSSVPIAAEQNSSYISAILTYRNTTLNLNSSWSALYSPHVLIQDQFNNRQIYVSPDGYAAGAISASAANFEIWYPAAGNKRGVLNVLDVVRRFTEGELDQLTDAQVNPIKFTPGKGIRIWGQSTLQSTPSKLQQLNVRLLLTKLEPAIKSGLEDFLFDLNDSSTRALAKGIVDALMQNIQARRGVSSFLTVCDATNNLPSDVAAGDLNVDLFLIPTGATTQINARLTITNEGVNLTTLNV